VILINSALPVAATYGLLALGYVVIYRATGVLNFAHGGFMLLGALIGFSIAKQGLVGVAVFPIIAAIGLITGALFYLTTMRPLAGQPAWVPVLVTVGVGFFLIIGIATIVWSPQTRSFSSRLGFANDVHTLLSMTFTTIQIVLMVAFVAIWGLLLAFYRWTRIGTRMRAASHDHHLAAYRGINIDLMFAMAWGLATGIGMFVGFAYAVNFNLDFSLAVLALTAFPVALAGGMDSILGVAAGALIVAFAQAATQLYVDASLGEIIPYAVLFVVLVVRPWGLFGNPEIVERV
jgi:branched-chain amino acid transport system permease protein